MVMLVFRPQHVQVCATSLPASPWGFQVRQGATRDAHVVPPDDVEADRQHLNSFLHRGAPLQGCACRSCAVCQPGPPSSLLRQQLSHDVACIGTSQSALAPAVAHALCDTVGDRDQTSIVACASQQPLQHTLMQITTHGGAADYWHSIQLGLCKGFRCSELLASGVVCAHKVIEHRARARAF